MGPILIVIFVVYLLTRKKDKKKCRTSPWEKSDWEKMCDDGAKFYGW